MRTKESGSTGELAVSGAAHSADEGLSSAKKASERESRGLGGTYSWMSAGDSEVKGNKMQDRRATYRYRCKFGFDVGEMANEHLQR